LGKNTYDFERGMIPIFGPKKRTNKCPGILYDIFAIGKEKDLDVNLTFDDFKEIFFVIIVTDSFPLTAPAIEGNL
jgi:hypothetical protein